MPITRNALIAATAIVPGATTVTASVTNTNGALLLLAVTVGGTGGTPASPPTGVTGLGLTWTQVNGINTFAGGNYLSVWKAQGAASTGAITITWGTSHANAIYQLDEFPGADPSAPIRQSGIINGGGGGGTAPSVTLGMAPLATSATYCVIDSTDTTATITAGSGFTLLGAGTTTIATPNQHLAVEWNNSGSPPALCAFARDVNFAGILVALEIVPPTFRSFTTATGTAVSAPISTPAGVAAGDCLVLFAKWWDDEIGSTAGFAAPPGFVFSSSTSWNRTSSTDGFMAVYTKMADGTEGATLTGTFVPSSGIVSLNWTLYALAFTGAGPGMGANTRQGTYPTSVTSFVMPGITMPAAGGAIALVVYAPSATLPAGMTSITSTSSFQVAYQVQAAGATGSRTTTFTSAIDCGAVMVGLGVISPVVIPSGIPTAQSVPPPAIVGGAFPQTVTPTSVPTAQSVPSPVILGGAVLQTVSLTSITSAQSVPSPQLNLTVFPSSIPTAQSVPAPSVGQTITITAGIPTRQSVPTPNVNFVIQPSSIPSRESVPSLHIGPSISLTDWEVRVYNRDGVLVAYVPRWNGLTFQKLLSAEGTGSVVLDLDDDVFLNIGSNDLLNNEFVWEIWWNGKRVFAFSNEDIAQVHVAADGSRTATMSGRGLGKYLETGIVLPPGYPVGWPNIQPNWELVGVTAMDAFLQLLAAAQVRGAITSPTLTPTFTATSDSGSGTWTDVNDISIPPGDNLLSTFTKLVDLARGAIQPDGSYALADWIVQPDRTIEVRAPFGNHYESLVRFQVGYDQVAFTRARSRKDIRNAMYVETADGDIGDDYRAISQSTWGRRELYVKASDAPDYAAGVIYASRALDQVKDEKIQITITVLPDHDGRMVFFDYDVGDWVGVNSDDARVTGDYRIVSISVAVDESAGTVLQLGMQSLMAYQLDRLGKAITAGGGAGSLTAAVTGIGNNNPTPAQIVEAATRGPITVTPTSLTLSTGANLNAVYIDAGWTGPAAGFTADDPISEYEVAIIRIIPDGTTDPDAVAFLAAAVITDPIITDAVSNLTSALKAAGIWTKLKALWPFVGGSAFTHKWNLKDPRDLDAAYRLTFNGGWIHSLTTGVTPDGSTGYADTHLAPAAVLTVDSGSLGIYCRTASAGGGQPYDLACDDGDTNPVLVIAKYSSGSSFTCYGNSAFAPNTPVADALGFWVTNRLSTVTTVGWHNGSVLDTADHTVVMPSALLHLFLGCDNRGGAPTYFSSKNYALAFVADGLTNGESADFYTAVQAFQTSLSRNV